MTSAFFSSSCIYLFLIIYSRQCLYLHVSSCLSLDLGSEIELEPEPFGPIGALRLKGANK